MINKKMFYAIADLIEDNPERWDQDFWITDGWGSQNSVVYNGEEYICGTTQCVAGWAVVLQHGGYTGDQNGYSIMSDGHTVYNVSDNWVIEGANILGLSREDAYMLFHTTFDVRNISKRHEEYEKQMFDMPRVLREIADGRTVEEALYDAKSRSESIYD